MTTKRYINAEKNQEIFRIGCQKIIALYYSPHLFLLSECLTIGFNFPFKNYNFHKS